MKCSLGISNFLEEISSLSHSVVFLYFFALITEKGFLISSCYSLELPSLAVFECVFFPVTLLCLLCGHARLVIQSCPTLCDSVDCSPLGSSVHRILQARILEWVAISFSRRSSQPRDQTHISCVSFFADRFTRRAIREAHISYTLTLIFLGTSWHPHSFNKCFQALSITDSVDINLSKPQEDSEGQGSLECWSPWGRKVSDTTESLNNDNNRSKCKEYSLLNMGSPTVSWRKQGKGNEHVIWWASRWEKFMGRVEKVILQDHIPEKVPLPLKLEGWTETAQQSGQGQGKECSKGKASSKTERKEI